MIILTYNVQPLRSSEEINDFLFFLRRTANFERDTFLFLFGINNGLRMSDVVNLKVKNVRGSKQSWIIEKKTGKKKMLFLENLSDLIEKYTRDMHDEDWLFPSREGGHIKVNTVYKQYQKIAQQLGRDDIGTHTLRKTFGYHYYRKTRDIATLMEIYNHSSEKVTKRYLGITQDEIGDSLRDFRLGF